MKDFLIITSLGMAEALPAVAVFFIIPNLILKRLKVTNIAIAFAFFSAWIISGMVLTLKPYDVGHWQWTLGVCLASVAFFTFSAGISGNRRQEGAKH